MSSVFLLGEQLLFDVEQRRAVFCVFEQIEQVLRGASQERENNYVYSDEKSQFKVTEYSQGLSKYYSNSLLSTQKPTIPMESEKTTTGHR